MEFKELKNKNLAELNKLLAERRDKLRDSRFKVANRQLKDVRSIRKLKKEIAGIITLINKSNRNSLLAKTMADKEVSADKQDK